MSALASREHCAEKAYGRVVPTIALRTLENAGARCIVFGRRAIAGMGWIAGIVIGSIVLASGYILGGWTRSPLSGSMRSAVTFEALAHLRNQIFIAYKLCVPLLEPMPRKRRQVSRLRHIAAR
jgi:hypothetical protein